MHPSPSPARANFTLITECTPKSSGCNSVYSVVFINNVPLIFDFSRIKNTIKICHFRLKIVNLGDSVMSYATTLPKLVINVFLSFKIQLLF